MYATAEIKQPMINVWRNVYPHRLVLDNVPRGSILDWTNTRKMPHSGGPYILPPNPQFRKWGKKSLKGRYQFIFWGDMREAKLLAETGQLYPGQYGVAFEVQRDAINYKLWWG